MKRLAASALVLVATSGVATAGGYVGAGIGDAPSLSTDVNYASTGRSARVLLGYRLTGLKLGSVSIEGAYGGYGVLGSGGGSIDARELSLSGKYNYPLGDN